MASIGLLETLNQINEWYVPECRILDIPDAFCTPGMWAVLAAFMNRHAISPNIIQWHAQDQRTYSETICLSEALGYPSPSRNRPQAGVTYAPLVKLTAHGDGDQAVTTIGNWLREKVKEDQNPGIKALIMVIGELFDNVQSHGKGEAFATCQVYKDGRLEFALVDTGIGFLREIKSSPRHQHHANDHLAAIEWCLKEGNSTKKVEGDWVQSLPTDVRHNPHPKGVETIVGPNHHQGLGLYHFEQLASQYNGELYIASGDSSLRIMAGGQQKEHNPIPEWTGVAISCKFTAKALQQRAKEPPSERVQNIMDRMRV